LPIYLKDAYFFALPQSYRNVEWCKNEGYAICQIGVPIVFFVISMRFPGTGFFTGNRKTAEKLS